jgi:hypothetical protein
MAPFGAEFGFGQPHGGIIQMAYVVTDIHAAMRHWIDDLRVGPWFLLPHFTGTNPIYRGAPSRADVSIAMAFAGHMQIELIQPNDDHPSVYRELLDRSGPGFHHFGIASTDIDGDIAALAVKGYTLAFRCGVPTGGEVAYMDGGMGQPGLIEYIEASEGMDATFTGFFRAAQRWEGSDPVRPMAG